MPRALAGDTCAVGLSEKVVDHLPAPSPQSTLRSHTANPLSPSTRLAELRVVK